MVGGGGSHGLLAGLGLADFDWRQFCTLYNTMSRGEKIADDTGMGFGTKLGGGSSTLAERLGTTAGKVGIALAFLIVAGMLGVLGYFMGVTGALDAAAAFSMTAMMVAVMTVFFGLYQAVNVLYFTRELGFYLSLPLSASVIMWAKLARFLGGAVVSDLMVLPLGLGALVGMGASAPAYALMAVAFLICVAAINLALTVVVVLIMRFSRFAHNKDRFNRFFGAFVTVAAIAFAVGAQFLRNGNVISGGIDLVQSGVLQSGPFQAALAVLCLPSALGGWVFSPDAGLAAAGFALMLAALALYALMLQLCASRWYFDGVRAMQSAGGEKSHTRFDASQLRRVAGARSAFAAFLDREFKTLMRVPVFFNQFVLSSLMMPLYMLVIMGISVLVNLDSVDFDTVLIVVQDFASKMSFGNSLTVGVALGLLAFMAFMGFMSYSYTMSVSRDGDDFFYLRGLPVDWRAYLLAKLASGFVLSAVPVLVLVVLLLAVAKVPVPVAVYLLVLALACTASLALVSLGIGVFWPNLHWESEAEVFKGGKSGLMVLAGFALGVAVLLVPGVCLASALIADVAVPAALAACLAVETAECAAGAWWVLGPCVRRLAALER